MITLTVATPFVPRAVEFDPEVRDLDASEPEAREEGRTFYIVTGILGAVMFVLCGLAVASMALAINFS